MLRRPPAAVSTCARARVSARPARLALRMQSEDDKAKAAGAGLFLFGLVYSGFSVFWGVLAGGVAVYAGKSCLLNTKLVPLAKYTASAAVMHLHSTAQYLEHMVNIVCIRPVS